MQQRKMWQLKTCVLGLEATESDGNFFRNQTVISSGVSYKETGPEASHTLNWAQQTQHTVYIDGVNGLSESEIAAKF